AEAFRKYGIDVEALEPAEAAARIRARKIWRELTVALDNWARERREARKQEAASWKRLFRVARAADPDPLRNQVREALERTDPRPIAGPAGLSRAGHLPVQTVSLLGVVLDGSQAEPLLRRAQSEHPDDFWLNFQLAWIFDWAPSERQQPDEAIRFYTAAL